MYQNIQIYHFKRSTKNNNGINAVYFHESVYVGDKGLVIYDVNGGCFFRYKK